MLVALATWTHHASARLASFFSLSVAGAYTWQVRKVSSNSPASRTRLVPSGSVQFC